MARRGGKKRGNIEALTSLAVFVLVLLVVIAFGAQLYNTAVYPAINAINDTAVQTAFQNAALAAVKANEQIASYVPLLALIVVFGVMMGALAWFSRGVSSADYGRAL
jgi:hypothetical protein